MEKSSSHSRWWLLVLGLIVSLGIWWLWRLAAPTPIPVTHEEILYRTWQQVQPIWPQPTFAPILTYRASDPVTVENLPRFISFGARGWFRMSKYSTDTDFWDGSYKFTPSGQLTLTDNTSHTSYRIFTGGEMLYLSQADVTYAYVRAQASKFP